MQRTEPATTHLDTHVKPPRDTFLKHNAIFLFGGLAIGGLNYLYYPVMGRLLNTGSFGEVQALFSLFAQIMIFLNVLSLLTVNIVVNYADAARRNRVILELEKLALLVCGLLVVGAIASGTLLRNFFHFGSGTPFVLLALAVLVSAPLAFRTGYLRGRQRFSLVVVAGVVASACDLLFSIAFVLAGRGTGGAMLGLVLAQLVGFLLAAHIAKRQGFTESLRQNIIKLPDLKLIMPELKYALLVLVGSLVITGLYSVDTVVVKHYFDASTAGLYAGISTVARIIFFLTTSISQVLLPSVKLQTPMVENRAVLRKSFLLMAILGGGALLIFATLPRTIIGTLMGHEYQRYAELLPALSLMVFVVSVVNLFVMYHLALRRYAVAPIMLAGVAVTGWLLSMHHQSLTDIVHSLLYGSISILVFLGIWSIGKIYMYQQSRRTT